MQDEKRKLTTDFENKVESLKRDLDKKLEIEKRNLKDQF
jgi:hypothetical protein